MQDSILAGPILRRATINRVCVWLAASQSSTLKLEVFSGTNKIGQSNPQRLYTERTQIGENLFVYLLEARCRDGESFPQDEFLTYQVVSEEQGNASVFDESELAYPGFNRPSFYISKNLGSLFHGSCRKPHGAEQAEDALYQAHKTLQENSEDRAKRPPVLMLTGDQIYADDVAIALLSLLRKKARELMGKTEQLPVEKINEKGVFTKEFIDPDNIELNAREKLLKDYKTGFTSGNAENHLLTLGEYVAMYIYMFGNVKGWRAEQNWQTLRAEGVYDEDDAREKFDEQSESLNVFEKTLPDIRRLLANIATYMIFDDHDVTDDWNLTNSWYDNVRDSRLGRRVVSNALASYWAFQGIGNDPDHFDHDFKATISAYGLQKVQDDELTERYDLQLWKHRGWGFSVPTSPPIIAIDSRTQRARTLMSYLPILVDRYGLDWLRVEWAKLKTDQNIKNFDYPIFITTTPLMGFTFAEMAQRILLWLAQYIDNILFKLLARIPYVGRVFSMVDNPDYLTQKIIQWADMEGWATNSTGQFKLLDCLTAKMHIKQCVVLSGDVHYGFTGVGRYQFKNTNFSCLQLTSSSLKNTPADLQKKALDQIKSIGDGTTRYVFLANTRLPGFIEGMISKKDSPGFILKMLRMTEIKLIPADGDYVVSDVNLGLLEFENGKPAKHHLMNSVADREYDLVGRL